MTEPSQDPAPLIAPSDLVPFAKIDATTAAAMIEDALGQAEFHAPCITRPDFAHRRMVKSILRGAILRWHEALTGSAKTKAAGIYSQTEDNRPTQPRKAMFYPSEIDQLKSLCRPAENGGAFAIDMLPPSAVQHAETCTLRMGGNVCSCGANLTGALGYPLYEPNGGE